MKRNSCCWQFLYFPERLNPLMPVGNYIVTSFLFAVRETASLGIMGAPRVPPLNPSESIVLSKHYRL